MEHWLVLVRVKFRFRVYGDSCIAFVSRTLAKRHFRAVHCSYQDCTGLVDLLINTKPSHFHPKPKL